jgi:hypothetical protein
VTRPHDDHGSEGEGTLEPGHARMRARARDEKW